ncbi:MAG: phosphoribosylformylglycinamidine synthase subunit PurS [bacterium]
MGWRVNVYVTLKPSVMDPQGATVQRALAQMGYGQVTQVRLGKFTEIDFDGLLAEEQVRKQADEICDKLLANPNIESYRFTVEKK